MTAGTARRIRGKDVAVALSLANLCYLRLWVEVLGVTSTEAYFLSVANSDVAALMVNVLLLAAIFLGLAWFARGYGRGGRIAMVTGFVLVLAVQLNSLGPELAPGVLAVIDRWRNGLYLEALAPVAFLLVIAAAAYRWPRRALAITVGTVYVLTPFVAVTFIRGLWILLVVDPSNALAPEAPPIGTPVATVEGPRVVVIVMDALGRRHAVEDRPEGFVLPELDRLRAISLDATQVEQIGRATKISVPAMLSGLRVTDSHPVSADELLLTIDSSTTQPWSTAPSLLRDAQALGGVAIVAGWYHPYCRLFPTLDGCSTYPTRTIGSRGRSTGFLRAVVEQQRALTPYASLRWRQVEIVRSQHDDAVEAVTQGGRGLIFLHMVLPHTPWIWDDEEGGFTVTRFDNDGYYGNMELMDRFLGDLRHAMEATGKWDSTAVLLLSDHVMRYRPAYLDEPVDHRVPFILKMPGATEGLVYDRPFSAMVTYDLVELLLRGELHSVHAAAAWLDTR